MKRFFRTLSIIISFTILGACAPNSEDKGSVAKTTYEPKKPVVVKEGGYSIAKGATRVYDLNVVFDRATKSMSLKGKIEYLSMKGHSLETLGVDLKGLLDKDGFIKLKDTQTQKEGVQLAAKATCLDANPQECFSSFIDIYLYTDGVVYHHQVETHGSDETVTPPKEGSHDQPPQEQPKKQTPPVEDPPKAPEVMETEGDSDEAEGDSGQYVGSLKEDIQVLLMLNLKTNIQRHRRKLRKQKHQRQRLQNTGASEDGSSKQDPPKTDPPKTDPKREEPTAPVPGHPPRRQTPEEPKQDPKQDPQPEVPHAPIPRERPEHHDEPATPTPQLSSVSQAVGPVSCQKRKNQQDPLICGRLQECGQRLYNLRWTKTKRHSCHPSRPIDSLLPLTKCFI